MRVEFPLRIQKKVFDVSSGKKETRDIDTVSHVPQDVGHLDEFCKWIYDSYGGGRFVVSDSRGSCLFEGLVFADNFNVLRGSLRGKKEKLTFLRQPMVVSQLKKIEERIVGDIQTERKLLSESMDAVHTLKGELRRDLKELSEDIDKLDLKSKTNRDSLEKMKFDIEMVLRRNKVSLARKINDVELLIERQQKLLAGVEGRVTVPQQKLDDLSHRVDELSRTMNLYVVRKVPRPAVRKAVRRVTKRLRAKRKPARRKKPKAMRKKARAKKEAKRRKKPKAMRKKARAKKAAKRRKKRQVKPKKKAPRHKKRKVKVRRKVRRKKVLRARSKRRASKKPVRKRRWSRVELTFLRRNYGKLPARVIAKRLSKSRASVKLKANRLGLKA